MEPTARRFKDNAHDALNDALLQKALVNVRQNFIAKRRKAADRLPEFEALRDQGRDIKNHTLENLDFYLERYEEKLKSLGGQLHWAPTAEDARAVILQICQRVGAKMVTKDGLANDPEIRKLVGLE